MADEVTTWTDPAGTVTTLDVEWGAAGRFMPPILAIEDIVPGQPGSRRRMTQHKPKDVLLPLWITAVDDVTLRAKTRALVYAFDPTRGDGILTVTAPDGTQRKLTCRSAAGLELGEKADTDTFVTWQRAALQLHANDPYFYDTSTQVLSYALNPAAATPFFPFFPLTVSGDGVIANTTITNGGDIAAWPVWTITGPGTGTILVANDTLGQQIALTQPLGSTDVLTIDTRPGIKSVRLASGVNAFSLLTPTSTLWPLAPGPNAVRVIVSGASVATSVTLVYVNRYLSP